MDTQILDDDEDYDSDEDDVPQPEEHLLLPAEVSKAAERGWSNFENNSGKNIDNFSGSPLFLYPHKNGVSHSE